MQTYHENDVFAKEDRRATVDETDLLIEGEEGARTYVGNTRSEEKIRYYIPIWPQIGIKYRIKWNIIEYPQKYDNIFHLGLPQEHAYSYSPRRGTDSSTQTRG